MGHSDAAIDGRELIRSIPIVWTYGFNLVTFVLAPYSVYWLCKIKMPQTSFLFWLFAIVAMSMQGAKSFAVLFTIQSFWVWWKHGKVTLAVPGFFALLFGLFVAFNQYSPRHFIGSKYKTQAARAANELACKDGNVVECQLSYLIYRIGFVPWEVRGFYYEYFANHNPLGFSSHQHPARIIGDIFYHQRDSSHYARGAMAYSSFDSDAFSRNGVAGVVIVCGTLVSLIFLLLRRKVHGALYGLPWIHLITSLPQSSMQAILGAQFFIVWFLLLHRNKEVVQWTK